MSAPNSNEISNKFKDFVDTLWNFFHDLLDLKGGLDKEGTIINIKNNKKMEGANAWLLMCSIFIASLGLDLNSPAVIIGAMLISPLMAPILGIGLGIGINDKNTLSISGRHFLIAIGIALFTSTLYFAVSGWLGTNGGFTNEIKGRTSPNILDAMVALIGGLAGIISSSRKDKSNAIPGVAIATALMPPLCVTGYGLAHTIFGLTLDSTELKLNFFNIIWNSFFLFFLNATLVALATYFIVRTMGFPTRSFDPKQEERQSKLLLYATSIFLLGISIYTTYNIINQNKITDSIERFVDSHFGNVKLEDCEIEKNIQTNTYDVTVSVMQTLSEEDSIRYNNLLKEPPYNIQNATIHFIDLPKMNEAKLIEMAKNEGVESYKAQFALEEKRKEHIDSLENEIATLKVSNKKNLENKIKKLTHSGFPSLEKIEYYASDSPNQKPPTISVQWNRATLARKKTRKEKEKRLKKMVIDLLEIDTVIVTHFVK